MFVKKNFTRHLKFAMTTVAAVLFFTAGIMAQNLKVSGKVTDKAGEPIVGAYVMIQGTTTGTSTDVDGKYSINAPSNSSLHFTFMGYKDKIVPINGKATLNIVMEEDAIALDEVVMVAYGSQKKENLSGAVSSINVGKAIESRPITDVGRALQGSTPGLIVTTTSGALGITPNIKIRGTTSTLSGNTGNPLILIDNVEVPDLSYVNPEDIESISTLKDASTTSIYGARAAFGAILITTKKGNKDGSVKVSYSNNFAWGKPTNLPEFSRADLGMQYSLDQHNGLRATPAIEFSPYSGYRISEASIIKTKEWIDKYGDGSSLGREMVEGRDFDYNSTGIQTYFYRPWDVRNLFYKEWAPQQTHNLSVAGGTEKIQYNLSTGLMHQNGVLKEFKDFYTRKSFSGNISTQVHKKITLRGGFMYSQTGQEEPMSFYSGVTDLQSDIYSPTYYIYRWHQINPYGTYKGKEFRNGIAEMKAAKPKRNDSYYSRFYLGASIDIIKGLKANFDYTYNQTFKTEHRHGGYLAAIDIFGGVPINKKFDDIYRVYTGSQANYASYDSSKNIRNAYNGNITYDGIFGKHSIKAMVGTNIEDAEYIYQRSKRLNLYDIDKGEVNLASGDQLVDSRHTWWAVAGVYARINYNFNEKYLLEGNIRYDESSRFAKGSRGGWFPSVSAAWRITEEPWMKPVLNIMNSLKIRGSYGIIGNQDVPLNSFIPTLTVSNPSTGNYWLVNGNFVPQVTNAAALVDNTLTWEKVSTLDFGIDARFWKDKIGVTFDWYQRKTMDMLSTGAVLPSSVGAKPPKQNHGELTTNGIEFEINFTHTFSNGLRLMVGGNFTDYTSKITKWANADDPLITDNYVGKKIGDIWGYEIDRLWQADDFVWENGKIKTDKVNGKQTNVFHNYKTGYQQLYESGAFRFSPGDIKIRDINGDGEINYGKNTLNDHGDLSVIGNTEPRYIYSFRAGIYWKGFDLDLFFQGVGKRSLWVTGNMVLPGWQGTEANFAHTLDYWTPENTGGFYPRAINYSNISRWNYIKNDRYLLNMAYLRLKNLTFGYTLPARLTRKAYINKLRVYFSGENLFEFDKLGDNPIDPELDHTNLTKNDARAFGRAYPYRRTLSFGIQIDF